MTISDEVLAREITEVLHFTTNRGLVGSLAARAVLSRRALPAEAYLEHVLHPNARTRPEESYYFDKSEDWLDYINMSVSEINRRFFNFSEDWHKDTSVWWVIMAFDTEIMSHHGVYFTSTNNSYPHCLRATGVAGFRSMFETPIKRKGAWVAHRASRGSELTTCEQAEVLYPGRVATEYLRRVYTRTDDERDIVRGFVKEFGYDGVEVLLSPQKFLGKLN